MALLYNSDWPLLTLNKWFKSQCPGWYDCMQVFTITSPVLINAKIVFPVLFSCVINSAISLCETILLIKFLKNVSIQREGAQTS